MVISNELFLVLGLLIFTLFVMRSRVVDIIFDITSITLKPIVITYISVFLLGILLLIGVLLNEGPGKLSTGFESMEPESNKKPHRYFDIKTEYKE